MSDNKITSIVLEGSKVTIKRDVKIQIVTIVPTKAVGTGLGYISPESPLGRAIMGLKEGDVSKYENPSGQIIYVEILHVG